MSRSSHPTPNMDEKISIGVKEESQISRSESKIVSSTTQVDYLSSSFAEPGLRRPVNISVPNFTSQYAYVSPIFIPVAQLASATQPSNYPGSFRATFSANNFKSATSLSNLSPSFNMGQPSASKKKFKFDLNAPPESNMESEDALEDPYVSRGSVPNDRETVMLHSFQKAPYFTSTLVPSHSKLSYPAQIIPNSQMNHGLNPAGSIIQPSSYLNSDFLNSYLALKQGPPRKYKCTMCPAEFSTPQAYGGHMSSHSKSRKAQLAQEEDIVQGKKARLSPLVPAENEKAMRGHVDKAKQVQMIKDAEEKKEDSTEEAETPEPMGA